MNKPTAIFLYFSSAVTPDLHILHFMILENGRIDERGGGQIIAHPAGKLIIRNKKVYIDRVGDIK